MKVFKGKHEFWGGGEDSGKSYAGGHDKCCVSDGTIANLKIINENSFVRHCVVASF